MPGNEFNEICYGCDAITHYPSIVPLTAIHLQ